MQQRSRQGRRRLIVTADDFGLCDAVNDAIERGHCEGILTTASLMVAAPSTADAVARAKRMQDLRVGLHLVLVNGVAAAPPEEIPALADAKGALPTNLGAAGVRYFFTPGVRRQLEREIREQFARFAATGLALDHVNAQNHMHVHPTVFNILLRVARDYGSPPVRIPFEPFAPSWRSARTHLATRLGNAYLLAPWLAMMAARLDRERVAHNDFVFGLNDTGHMTPARVRALLQQLPSGVTELYVHPATHRWDGVPQGMHDYDFAGELAALVDPEVARYVAASNIEPATFGQLAAERAG